MDEANHGSTLAEALVGTWRLLSRIDRAASGKVVTEPSLGSDPVALLFFDGSGNFAAQFMKRDRREGAEAPSFTAVNNTTAIGGYDAYFGTYEVDEVSHQVSTRMTAALAPANVGMAATRMMRVEEGTLVIRLESTAIDGKPVIRTLTWERAG
jgi:hypothetical protein